MRIVRRNIVRDNDSDEIIVSRSTEKSTALVPVKRIVRKKEIVKPVTLKKSLARDDKSDTAFTGIKGSLEHSSLTEYTEKSMREYGTEVVEHRAVSDFRDGLKPVHRYILWAMYKLGLNSSGPYKKSARTVGDVIGIYHPRGDASVYDAMTNIVNSPVQLVEGSGNWGNFIDEPAAFRYTEARLSRFSEKYLLDPDYLKVTEMIPNYSRDAVMPLVLPAKLPVLLLNGSISIAFGIAAGTPPFHIDGVTELVRLSLKGTKITPALCLRHLKFNYLYGGVCVSEKEDILAFFKNGYGSLFFKPEISINQDKKIIYVTSACPGGLSSEHGINSFVENLAEMEAVKNVQNVTDKTGFRISIIADKHLTGNQFSKLVQAVTKLATRKVYYNIGVTERKSEHDVVFRRDTVMGIIEKWSKWRVEIELKVLDMLIVEYKKDLKFQNLLLLAIKYIDVMTSSLKVDEPIAFLMKRMKVSEDDAKTLLNFRFMQLTKLERQKILDAISKIENNIKQMLAHKKIPENRILADLEVLTKTKKSARRM